MPRIAKDAAEFNGGHPGENCQQVAAGKADLALLPMS